MYAFCGVFVFLILRALGELLLHRPSSGSFVSYAVRARVLAVAQEREGYTGQFPVIANRPPPGEIE